MAEELNDQEPEQEPEQEPGQEPEQEPAPGEEPGQEPAETPQDEPEKKKSRELLMPVLYALLAAVGAFTLVMIAGIVWTILTQPADPLESPSEDPSTQIVETQPSDGEGSDPDGVRQNTTAESHENQSENGGENENVDNSGNSSGNGNADNFNTYNNPDQQQTDANYVLNTNTMKFHYPFCDDVARIAPENYVPSYQTREEIINSNYSPCGHCNP